MTLRQRPVVGLDIDGTIGAYHQHFIRYAEGYLGKPIDPDYDGRIEFHRHIGVGKTRYREMKLAYRRGSLKRSMPTLPAPYPDASTLTHMLRKWGIDVWLCTTRPYLSHDNVDVDTRFWVRHNRVACKGIIWGEHKYRELARTVGKDNVVAVLDDIPEMCDQAHGLYIPAILAVRDHNRRQPVLYPEHHRAETMEETVAVLKRRYNEWRSK